MVRDERNVENRQTGQKSDFGETPSELKAMISRLEAQFPTTKAKATVNPKGIDMERA